MIYPGMDRPPPLATASRVLSNVSKVLPPATQAECHKPGTSLVAQALPLPVDQGVVRLNLREGGLWCTAPIWMIMLILYLLSLGRRGRGISIDHGGRGGVVCHAQHFFFFEG